MQVTPSLAGTSVVHFMSAIRSQYGEDALRRGLARLEPAARTILEEASPMGWIPMDVVGQAVDLWAAEAGVTGEELTRLGVRLATKESFNTVFKIFLRLNTDEALIARTPLIYAKTRNIGHLAVEEATTGAARLVLTEWPDVTERQLLSIATAIETLLEITGRTNPSVKGRRVEGGGVFVLRWGRAG
jgi:hypothetical protein